jgi:hypothetical protein
MHMSTDEDNRLDQRTLICFSSQLGRLTHYAFDAVLLSAFLAGVKRSTGLTYVSSLQWILSSPLSAHNLPTFGVKGKYFERASEPSVLLLLPAPSPPLTSRQASHRAARSVPHPIDNRHPFFRMSNPAPLPGLSRQLLLTCTNTAPASNPTPSPNRKS